MMHIAISILLIPAITVVSNEAGYSYNHYLRFVDSNLENTHKLSRDITATVKTTAYDRTHKINQQRMIYERNQDDDHTNGSDSDTKSSSKKSRSAPNPYAISKDVAETASTTTTTISNSHHNVTIGDSIEFDDDSYSSNITTPIRDMKDVMNANIEVDNNATVSKAVKVVLPPEHALSETWIIAIVSLFVSMAISLCITTAIRRCRKNSRRTGYQEVSNIVV